MARVLVVEDDEALIDFLESMLTQLGHEVVCARDGAVAEEILSLTEPFDLILCDLALPHLSGHDLLERVEDRVRDITPVVIVSGEDQLLETLEDVAEWVFDVVHKPFHLPRFREVVDRALEYRRIRELAASGTDEVSVLAKRIRDLEHRIRDLSKQNVELYELARLDPLTRLPNRLRFEEDIARRFANMERYGVRFALGFIDVDGFRRFNGRLGYEGGDRAICHVARLLRQVTRGGDTVYRYGGDEFFIVMEAQSLEHGVTVAERVRAAVADVVVPDSLGGGSERITVSIGVVAGAPGSDGSFATLVREANKRLAEAKAAGGNRVEPSA